MRRLGYFLLAPLLVAFMGSSTYAQTQLSAGVKAGVGIANLGGDAEQLFETSLKSKLGFAGGAFLGVDLHENFRLQFEGQYVMKGAKAEEQGVDVKLKLDYIELLVPLTLMVPVEGNVSPRFYAGPALGLEVSCKLSGEEGGVSVDVDCADAGADTKSIDIGVFFGGGVDLAVGTGAITLDALYNLGLTNINDTAGTTDLSAKNQNIQIMAGYRFFFGG